MGSAKIKLQQEEMKEESIEEEGPETKAGWGIGFQQTEKNTKSPQKKSYSSGEGWSKNKDD